MLDIHRGDVLLYSSMLEKKGHIMSTGQYADMR